VESGLRRRWPQNLSVENLEISGSLDENDIEYLTCIKITHNLFLNCVVAEQMYQLLERMGRFVKLLLIGDHKYRYRLRQDIVFIKNEIIVERILSACPNLEVFAFKTSQPVVKDELYNLPPSAFKNYKQYDY
jgi:hypothetical protein